jgi:hypothetical protein
MRERARRDSALAWMRSGAQVAVGSYAKRYGVDRGTAYAELKAIGYPLPASADRWARRRPAQTFSRRREADVGRFAEPDWVMVGDRRMFVVGYTPNGVPFGCDELDDTAAP